MSILNILNQLEADAGRLAKIAILEANKGNKLLQTVLVKALNPYITFGIKKIPKYESSSSPGIILEQAIEALFAFEARITTGNRAIETLTDLLTNLSADDAVVLERIIKKDLRCGVQASTVNKIWPDLIPTFPCLLGKAYDDKTIQNIVWPAYAQIKADGMRAMAWLDEDGTVRIHGRSGKPIEFGGVFENRIRALLEANPDLVFDGELVVLGDDNRALPRKKGNGLLNSFIRPSSKIEKLEKELEKVSEHADRVRIGLWDTISQTGFKTYTEEMSYADRLNRLELAVAKTPSEFYSIIETRIVDDLDEANEYFAESIARGEEGIMLKNKEMFWKDTRSNEILKFKSELECDLEVVGWNPGKAGTKREGKVGSLICASLEKKVIVNISGFPDDLLDEITANIDSWIGKIVAVKYNERIASKEAKREGVDSLFLPRYLEERLDKSVADSSEVIK